MSLLFLVNLLSSISATLSNVLVILSILKTPSLHTPSNVLLFSLAVSDLGVGLVVQPLLLSYLCNKSSKTLFMAEVFSANIVSGASVFTMTAIAVDRYLALVLHLRYRAIVTVRRTVLVSTGIWVASILTAPYRYIVGDRIFDISVIPIILFCFAISSYCHIQIHRTVRRHRRQIIDQAMSIARQIPTAPVPSARRGKSITTMYYIQGLFIVCFCSIPILICADKVFKATSVTLNEIAWTILYLNSTFNPFVYCWRMQEMRCAIKLLLAGITKLWKR